MKETHFEEGHVFSQHGLNTYVRCPRRFYWHYIVEQPWPTAEGEQAALQRQALARGRIFHQWMARRYTGISMDALAQASTDPNLVRWWKAAETLDINNYEVGKWLPEVPLVVPIGRFNLYARFDLVSAGQEGAVTVVDWKTLERRPTDEVMQRRMQTRVYLYAAAQAGQALLSGDGVVLPEKTRMVYWFTNAPDELCVVDYSREQMQKDGAWFTALAEEIASRGAGEFEKTEDLRQCARCMFKPLCDRDDIVLAPDEQASSWTEEELDLSLDAEGGEELEF